MANPDWTREKRFIDRKGFHRVRATSPPAKGARRSNRDGRLQRCRISDSGTSFADPGDRRRPIPPVNLGIIASSIANPIVNSTQAPVQRKSAAGTSFARFRFDGRGRRARATPEPPRRPVRDPRSHGDPPVIFALADIARRSRNCQLVRRRCRQS
jgi:hypothetical protein